MSHCQTLGPECEAWGASEKLNNVTIYSKELVIIVSEGYEIKINKETYRDKFFHRGEIPIGGTCECRARLASPHTRKTVPEPYRLKPSFYQNYTRKVLTEHTLSAAFLISFYLCDNNFYGSIITVIFPPKKNHLILTADGFY